MLQSTKFNLQYPPLAQESGGRGSRPSSPRAIILEYARDHSTTIDHIEEVNQAYANAGGNPESTETLVLADFPEAYNATNRFNGSMYGPDFFSGEEPKLQTEDDIRQYILAQMDFELGRFSTALNTIREEAHYEDVGVINYSIALTETSFLKEILGYLDENSELSKQQVESLIDSIVDGTDEASKDHVNSLYSQLQQSAKALYDDQGTVIVAGAGNSRHVAAQFENQGLDTEEDEDDTLLGRILGEQEQVIFATALGHFGGYADYSSLLGDQPRQYSALPEVGNGTSFSAPIITAYIQQLQMNPEITLDEIHASLKQKFQPPEPSTMPSPAIPEGSMFYAP